MECTKYYINSWEITEIVEAIIAPLDEISIFAAGITVGAIILYLKMKRK